MALITCPECGKQFSEFADKCPNCGCPTDKIKELQKPAEEPRVDNEVQKAAEPARPVVAAEHKVAKIITIAVVAGMVIALFVIIGIGTKQTKEARAVEAVASAKRDSIEKAQRQRMIVEQQQRDSIARLENAATIKKLKGKFREKKDDFNSTTWILPTSAPRYSNQNGVYCYFAKSGLGASGFRFRFQYAADNWLFIEKIQFNIDDRYFTITPDMKRDHNTSIWEWCDVPVSSTGDVTEDLIKKISVAKSVKMRLVGMQYYKDKTMSSAQIQSIKDTYEYYKALGGSFY